MYKSISRRSKSIRMGVMSILLALISTTYSYANDQFVQTSGTQFSKNGSAYYYIGTNFWYGPILASEGRGGDIDRLEKELGEKTTVIATGGLSECIIPHCRRCDIILDNHLLLKGLRILYDKNK